MYRNGSNKKARDSGVWVIRMQIIFLLVNMNSLLQKFPREPEKRQELCHSQIFCL